MVGILGTFHDITRLKRAGVIAEGIETESHAQTLLSMDCSQMQGYFFAKPMPAEQATEFLLEYNSPTAFESLQTAR